MLSKYKNGALLPYEVFTVKTPEWAKLMSKYLYDELDIWVSAITLDQMENTMGNPSELYDKAIEKNDMAKAMQEYQAAMNLMPANLEMQYWTAITLANNKQVDKALPILKKLFAADKNWKTLTRRLPAVNLLTVSEPDLQRILDI